MMEEETKVSSFFVGNSYQVKTASLMRGNIFLTTHNMHEAEKLCDNIALLNDKTLGNLLPNFRKEQ